MARTTKRAVAIAADSVSEPIEQTPPLAETKLAAPRQQGGIVRRPRLLGMLDAADEAALTLVSAPPSYGKTNGVRAWCARTEASTAWVMVDALAAAFDLVSFDLVWKRSRGARLADPDTTAA